MSEIRVPEADARLSEILSDVERGETIVITRDGRPIARVTAEFEDQAPKVRRIFDGLKEIGRQSPGLTLDDLLSGRHEGHRF